MASDTIARRAHSGASELSAPAAMDERKRVVVGGAPISADIGHEGFSTEISRRSTRPPAKEALQTNRAEETT